MTTAIMNSIRITLAALALGLLLPATAQTTRQITASKATEYGLTYTLPVTAFDITVVAERTVSRTGELARYAGKYLGIDNPVRESGETWRVTGAYITPVGVDGGMERRYLVQFKSGSTPTMVLTDDGLPLAVNTEPVTAAAQPLPQSQAPAVSVLDTPYARQAMTEDMLRSQSTAKRAELAAAKIYELRESRNDIISGQAENMPGDGAAMQLALDNLARQEAALTAMFAGTRETGTEVRTFRIVPDGNTAARTVIARVSATDGFVDIDDLSGMPVTVDISDVKRGELPLTEKGEPKKFPKGGLAYAIPGHITLTVTDCDGKTLTRSEGVPAAQYGTVFGLEPNIFTDKREPATARFSPATGAIVELGTR